MLYFSFEVKMEGPKEKWGPKEKVEGGGRIFRAGITAPHFQLASYAYDLPRLWDCDIDVLVWQNER